MENFSEITKDELVKLYSSNSTAEISRKFGVCAETVRKRMKAFNIPRRNRGGIRTFNPSRDELHALYQEKSMREIALHFDVGETVVWQRLREFGIKLKDHEDGGHRKKVGRIFSEEHRKNMSKSMTGRSGERAGNWKGGISEVNLRARRTAAYRNWKIQSRERAGNKCESCGIENGSTCECCGLRIKLHVHHIKSFAKYVDLRFDPNNSEVLCPKCHHSRHHGKIG